MGRRVRPRVHGGITRPTPSAVGVDVDPTTSRRKDVPLVDTPALRRGSSTGARSRSGGGPLAPEGCVTSRSSSADSGTVSVRAPPLSPGTRLLLLQHPRQWPSELFDRIKDLGG